MRILLTTLALFINVLLIAQAPALIPYQAVARDASGQPLANTNVNARFTIHDGAATGASVWQELQTVSTSALGLFTVQLGSSMPLSGVNWADGTKYMQVEIDLGSGFVDIGTQQLLSVPYALSSGQASNGISNVSICGDTLYLTNGSFLIIPGISYANFGWCNIGCTDPIACNFNPYAIYEDNSCFYTETYYDCLGNCINDFNADGICDEFEVYGCTNSNACNYIQEATHDDGSCYSQGDPCNDYNTQTIHDSWNTDCLCSGELGIVGPNHSCGEPFVHNPNLVYGSISDQEGNVYRTIVIGNQEWMAENLNTSIYRNGDSIQTNLGAMEWALTSNGAWAYYNNDSSYACPYGKLYNAFACVDSRNLCPVGWHVPSAWEWDVLKATLGGVAAGGKMKTTGTVEAMSGLWVEPNSQATNSSGFSALPAGDRESGGYFEYLGSVCKFWSTSTSAPGGSWDRVLFWIGSDLAIGNSLNQYGQSVRCLKD
jgi:uncharacterized protein (TIGR02145 family)